ncbi:sulfate transporter [Rhodanobacter sp. FW510-R12]|uniref:STAS domain-containing protein n=1 Tax=unclassified Rhodanobacter TaxID=2621553 RepID=UPI0007A9A6A6|nr:MULTISPECIES: STAS domain-containing protein [unclassified Rhodanobacter]KZC18305.1 sulfate transporter [Rhodanobacter sp. FW104-R8]KZC28065.1 sulfate transporter [Rhodanobacter sp. FW510-T8]KZC33232.1 sulfate transporter [Rhodanobacter sp. FW510-R10]
MTDQAARGFQLDTATPATLGVGGELSFDTAAAALQAIQSALADGSASRLDLAGVLRSDSAGLACILAVMAGAARRGRPLQVVHMPAGMQALAQVCEVDRLIA